MTETLFVDHATVLRHLHKSLGFQPFHLHWVSHVLTDELREKRKDHAKRMPPFLHAAERDCWHRLVTDDEFWFYLKHYRVAWNSREK
jgi:hypothetical protein